MVAFNKFNSYSEAVHHGKHDFSSDQIKVALTNTAPDAADSVLADIEQIGYSGLSTRNLVTASSGQTGGLYKLVLNDLILTQSGIAGQAFRYPVLYNEDAPSDELIAYYDRGSSITLQPGESLQLDFSAGSGVLTMI